MRNDRTLWIIRLCGSLGHDPRSNGVGGRACRCERLQTGGVNDTRTIAWTRPPVWTHVWHGGQVFRFKRGARRFRVHLLTREDGRAILSLEGMLDNASLQINIDTFYNFYGKIVRDRGKFEVALIFFFFCIFCGKLLSQQKKTWKWKYGVYNGVIGTRMNIWDDSLKVGCKI